MDKRRFKETAYIIESFLKVYRITFFKYKYCFFTILLIYCHLKLSIIK